MSNKDEPAFPQRQMVPKPGLSGTGDPYYLATTGGLTKREYAAIQIMAGLAADEVGQATREEIANTAVAWADALFAELSKEPT